MKNFLVLILLITSFVFSNEIPVDKENPWIKTYKNYKNYNTLINNITKLEEKLKSTKNTNEKKDEILKKITINKSKLHLYENNNSFDTNLLKYKITLPKVTLLEFLFQNNLNEIKKTIFKFRKEKEFFYRAKAILQNQLEAIQAEEIKDDPRIKALLSDIDFFNEYTESIEKTDQNLQEVQLELEKKYEEYKNDVFIKHLFTLAIIFVFYILYKISSYIFMSFVNSKDDEVNKNYSKLLSLLFAITIFIFIVIRYIEDLVYIITFLGVVAAALTIAMREVLLNIAGAIYIFFTSVIKVGDRVMVQFETKHTIGDIINISLIKIKLTEIDDYTNIKDIKSAGRTIYIPNSYIFTKVFYNYSLKKNGIINDILEFEFDIDNNFDEIENIISSTLKNDLNLASKVSFGINSTKTAILCNISYETNFKQASKNRGLISIKLLSEFKNNKNIKLKASKNTSKVKEEEGE